MLLSAEIMEVVRDLCSLAAAWRVLGRPDKAAVLIEQSAALLAERARLIAAERAKQSRDFGGLQ